MNELMRNKKMKIDKVLSEIIYDGKLSEDDIYLLWKYVITHSVDELSGFWAE